MSFEPLGEVRRIGDLIEVQYVADSSHRHEGGHRIAIAGRNILVGPGGRTTARNRSHVITRVLHSVEEAEAVVTLGVDALVGALVRAGATNITIDGQRLFGDDEPSIVAALRVEVLDNGEIQLVSIGGTP